jgi:hypothetical protein
MKEKVAGQGNLLPPSSFLLSAAGVQLLFTSIRFDLRLQGKTK